MPNDDYKLTWNRIKINFNNTKINFQGYWEYHQSDSMHNWWEWKLQ